MKFTIRDHQGKSAPYCEALTDAGHEEVGLEERSDVILVDYDLLHPAYVPWIEAATLRGTPLIAYPHGFSATWVWDMLGDRTKVAASFVPGEGQKHLLELHDYPHPVHAIGWPGPRIEPIPKPLGTVLFAPHHPLGSGYLPPEHQEENAKAFRTLIEEPCSLLVRHVGSLEQSGLWREPGVRYIPGRMDGSMHTADVVVGSGTYAANCLVNGVPVVMYHQEREWRLASEWSPDYLSPPDWEKHYDFTRYPVELGPGVCKEAAENPNPPEVQEWRERFLGDSFDMEKFVEVVAEVVERNIEADALTQIREKERA